MPEIAYPWKPETADERSAAARPCPYCKAPAYCQCVTVWGLPVDRGAFHAARLPRPTVTHPWEPDTDAERLAVKRACPACHAPRGSKCVTRHGRPVDRGSAHARRFRSG